MAIRGWALRDLAGHGNAGEVRLRRVRKGIERQAWLGTAWEAWHGAERQACQGSAGQGSDGQRGAGMAWNDNDGRGATGRG